MEERDSRIERLAVELARELDGLPVPAPNPVEARYRKPAATRLDGHRRWLSAGALAAAATVLLAGGAIATEQRPEMVRWIRSDLERLPLPAGSPAAPESPPPTTAATQTRPRPSTVPGAEPRPEATEREHGEAPAVVPTARPSSSAPERERESSSTSPSGAHAPSPEPSDERD